MGRIRRVVRWVVRGRQDGVRSRLRARCRFGRTSSEQPVQPVGTPPPEPVVQTEPADAPDGFVDVCAFDELADGEIAEFIVGELPLALARIDGTYHAIANTCPHAGGPLGDGELTGTTVACPWHGWGFDVTSGTCELDPNLAVDVHEVVVRGDRVWVRPAAD